MRKRRESTAADTVCQGEVLPRNDVRELSATIDRRNSVSTMKRKDDITCIAAILSRLLRLEDIKPIASTKTAQLNDSVACPFMSFVDIRVWHKKLANPSSAMTVTYAFV
jgi:hypothetical protein